MASPASVREDVSSSSPAAQLPANHPWSQCRGSELPECSSRLEDGPPQPEPSEPSRRPGQPGSARAVPVLPPWRGLAHAQSWQAVGAVPGHWGSWGQMAPVSHRAFAPCSPHPLSLGVSTTGRWHHRCGGDSSKAVRQTPTERARGQGQGWAGAGTTHSLGLHSRLLCQQLQPTLPASPPFLPFLSSPPASAPHNPPALSHS